MEYTRKDVLEALSYNFASKTIGEVVDYLLIDRKRSYDYGRGGSPYCFNVKAHCPDVYKALDQSSINRALDAGWDAYMETSAGYDTMNHAYERAQDYYRKDWNSYPGDDQGAWEFAFEGRQGGWLCLKSFRNIQFRGDSDLPEIIAHMLHDYMTGGDPKGTDGDIVGFYMGIMCADQDFTPAKAEAEVSYQLADLREQWEEERDTDIDEHMATAIARAMRDVGKHYGFKVTVSAQGVADLLKASKMENV
ncbi:MAG: hypothetical protein AB7U75_14840 [Hyphomicrobiaceae bacterium]